MTIHTLGDYIETLDKDELIFYMGANKDFDSVICEPVFVVLPNLETSDDNKKLNVLCDLISNQGKSIFVLSSVDGPMSQSFTDEGFHVIVYENFYKDVEWLSKAALLYDSFIVSGMENIPTICIVTPSCKSTIWIVHESYTDMTSSERLQIPLLPSLQVYSDTISVQDVLRTEYAIDSDIIDYEDTTKSINLISGRRHMINSAPNHCSGCKACIYACPQSAIHMEENIKGFMYPVINRDLCIECGMCNAACPVNDTILPMKSEHMYAAQCIEDEQRETSQSGGAFWSVANAILEKGGVVYGVGYANLKASYMRIDEASELYKIKGSKYIQSDLGNIYSLIEDDLKQSRLVLFSGTPCYVDGVKRTFSKYEDYLYTCDIVCHGVPSPKIFKEYMDNLEKNVGQISRFNFRDKSEYGWHIHNESYYDSAENKCFSYDYARMFYTNLFLRESCYSCKYSSLNRHSDITVCDFWGIENSYPGMDDDKGTSVAIVNTARGQELLRLAMKTLYIKEIREEECIQINMVMPTERPNLVDGFWNNHEILDYRALWRQYFESCANNSDYMILSNWLEMTKNGSLISNYFTEHGIKAIALCGRMYTNSVIIKLLANSQVNVVCILDNSYSEKEHQAYGRENMASQQNVSMASFDYSSVDKIVITDEANNTDIMAELINHKAPVEKLIPMSFIYGNEV